VTQISLDILSITCGRVLHGTCRAQRLRMHYIVSVILRQLDLPNNPRRRLRFQLASARVIYVCMDLFIIGQLFWSPFLSTVPLLCLAHSLLSLQLGVAMLGLYLKTLVPAMGGETSCGCQCQVEGLVLLDTLNSH